MCVNRRVPVSDYDQDRKNYDLVDLSVYNVRLFKKKNAMERTPII